MALGVSATMAFLLLFSLVALSHCGDGALQLQVDSATNASSSSYRVVVPAKVNTIQDAEGLLRLPSSVAELDPDRSLVEPVAEPDPDGSPVEHVAEPDPDQSHPDSDELATNKPCSDEGQQGSGRTKEQIDGEEELEKERADRKKKEGKKKTKKHYHDGDDKGKKEKTKTKQHRQSDDEDKEEEEENTSKRIHRHHHAKDELVKKKKSKLSQHIKNYDNDDDSDDEAEEEKKVKRWRKAIKSRFGPGRRSQREEAAKDKVNN